MSSHGHQEGGDKGGEKRPELTQQHLLAQQNTLLTGQQARFAELLHGQQTLQHGDLVKATKIKAPIGSRQIAPAPGITVAGAVNVSSTKLIGQPAQHAIIPKAAAIASGLEGIAIQQSAPGTQTVAVNLSTQAPPASQASQALHIMTTMSQSLHPLTIPSNLSMAHAGGAVLQGQAFHTPQVSASADDGREKSRVTLMAPSMSAQIPMASLIRGTLPQALQQTSGQVSLSLAQAQGVTTPSQTSIIHALPPSHIPRGAAAASALTAPKVGAIATPILRPTHPTTATQMQGAGNNLLPTLTAQIQPRGLVPVRPGTPPVTQTTSSIMGVHNQAELQRAAQAQLLTSLGVSSGVQIAGLQGRPVLSQVPTVKATPGQQSFSSQKVVVSQSMSQLLGSATGGPTLVNVATPKLAGQNLALNLAHQQAPMNRPQKIMTTHAGALPTPSQVSIANLTSTQTLSFPQSIPRQKLVVTQATIPQSLPAGAMMVNTAVKAGSGSLGHTIHRPQKVIMSTPTTVPLNIANLPKGIAGLSVHGNTVTQVTSATAPTMISATTATSIPLVKKVKVQSHRPGPPQVVMTTAQALPHDQHQIHREAPAPAQPKPAVGPTIGSTAQVQPAAQLQGNLYGLPAGHRASPSGSQGNLPAVATSQLTTQVDGRPQTQDSRPQFHPHLPYALSEYYPYNLVYQPHTAFNPASNIRPTAAQNANLAATLQAAVTQAVVSSATGQPGVRLNPPVMVNVDPSHHSAIAMPAQFPGAKNMDGLPVSTVGGAVAHGGGATHPEGGMTTAVAHFPTAAHTGGQTPGGGASQPMNASPRPSILRKRPHEGVMMVKKNLLSSVNAVDALSSSASDSTHYTQPAPSPKHMGPCDPNRENSQSSTDTASSAESTPQSGSHPEVKVKDEPLESVENGAAAGLALFSQLQNNVEASPRKKPRKQQLHASEELKDGIGSDVDPDKLAKEEVKEELSWLPEELRRTDLKEFVDDEGVRWTRDRRRPPVVNLLNHYSCNWKTKNNHFIKHQDVKVKDERRPTVNELANQKGIHQKASGWKIYHLAAQMEELMDMEKDVYGSMTLVQESIAPKHIAKNPTMEDDISMVHELTQGNIQRCQLVMDQLEEARHSMVKVLDHKQRIMDIINKHHSKRPVKKKERN